MKQRRSIVLRLEQKTVEDFSSPLILWMTLQEKPGISYFFTLQMPWAQHTYWWQDSWKRLITLSLVWTSKTSPPPPIYLLHRDAELHSVFWQRNSRPHQCQEVICPENPQLRIAKLVQGITISKESKSHFKKLKFLHKLLWMWLL